MPRGTWAATRSKYRSRTTTSRRSTCGRMSSTKSGTTICYLSRSHNNDQVILRRLHYSSRETLAAPPKYCDYQPETIWSVDHRDVIGGAETQEAYTATYSEASDRSRMNPNPYGRCRETGGDGV